MLKINMNLFKWLKKLFSGPNIILIKGTKSEYDSEFPHDYAKLNAKMKEVRAQRLGNFNDKSE